MVRDQRWGRTMLLDSLWLAIFLSILLAGALIGLLLFLRSMRKTERELRAENASLRRSRKNVQATYTQVVSDLKAKQQEWLSLQEQFQAAQETRDGINAALDVR